MARKNRLLHKNVLSPHEVYHYNYYVTPNIALPYVAPYFYVIIIEYTTVGVKCDNCRLFALIVSYKKCILTQKFHRKESINDKYYYPTCTSNLLCTILFSFIHGLSSSAVCLINVCSSNVKTGHAARVFTSFLLHIFTVA